MNLVSYYFQKLSLAVDKCCWLCSYKDKCIQHVGGIGDRRCSEQGMCCHGIWSKWAVQIFAGGDDVSVEYGSSN